MGGHAAPVASLRSSYTRPQSEVKRKAMLGWHLSEAVVFLPGG